MTQISLTRGIHPHPWAQEPQTRSVLGSHFLLELCLRCAHFQSCLCFLSGLHAHLAGTLSPEWLFQRYSATCFYSFGPVSCCSWPDPMNWTSVLLFYFPLSGNIEVWYQQLALFTMVMACVGVTLLRANLPSGNSLISPVSDIRRLNIYTKLILNRCSYLFSQILLLIGLPHFYSPNNFPFNTFTVGAYWLIKSRTLN